VLQVVVEKRGVSVSLKTAFCLERRSFLSLEEINVNLLESDWFNTQDHMKPCSSIRLLEFWDKTTRKKWRSEEKEEEEGIAGHLFLGDKKIFFNLLGFLLDLQLIEPVGLWVNILEGGLPNRHWVVLLGFLHDSPLNGVSVDLFSVELASCFQSCFQNQQPYTTTSYAAALQATQEL
jgi:hypothetical protein